MKKNILSDVIKNGWKFTQRMYDFLSSSEKSFVEHEFAGNKNLGFYKNRLKAIGFTGKEKVLDAACGMGQWSLALAELNQSVKGVDINSGRLFIADNLNKNHDKDNVEFTNSKLETLPYNNEEFDLIFCYGSFMFTNMSETIKEFRRVLKPGGRVYLNANAFGWYLHMFFDMGLRKRNFYLTLTSIYLVLRTILCLKEKVVVSKKYLKNLMRDYGFKIIEIKPEGRINFTDNRIEPTYKSRFYGFTSIYEIVAEKKF